MIATTTILVGGDRRRPRGGEGVRICASTSVSVAVAVAAAAPAKSPWRQQGLS